MKAKRTVFQLCLLAALGLSALTSDAQPIITTPPTDQFAIRGGNVTLSVMVTGGGPFTYQWRLNGTNLPNQNHLITRVAGLAFGTTFSGDGWLATSAGLSSPSGVALDAAGRLFIADTLHYRIRMVDTNFTSTTNGLIGIIQTVAGNGTGASAGDGGYATNAGFSPTAVAVDGGGSIYICDSGNNRLRKVDANGFITTLAGTNSSGFSGDGGLAVNAKLAVLGGVTVDAWGNLFIADLGNDCIRKVAANGIITTFAGKGSAGFSGDGGAATNAALNQPNGVAVDADGDVFISDYANNRIRRVDAAGNISTVAGAGGLAMLGMAAWLPMRTSIIRAAWDWTTMATFTLPAAVPEPFAKWI